MKPIDFDRHFRKYTADWYKRNRSKYKNVDEMEELMPEIYLQWLNEPAAWLEGKQPGLFFSQFDDASMLVGWLNDYLDGGVSLPDPLPDRICDLGLEAEAPLILMLDASIDKHDAQKANIAISLLKQIQSKRCAERYIAYIVSFSQEGDEERISILDNMADALREMGGPVLPLMLEALEQTASRRAQVALLDVLSRHPVVPRVREKLIEGLFLPGYKGLFAAYLGNYGDPEAIGHLEEALKIPDLNYLDYIEIRNAIERLGGEVKDDRDFSGDPDYEALSKLEFPKEWTQ